MRRSAIVTQEVNQEQLAFAVARNQVGEKLPIEQVLQTEGVSPQQFDRYLNDPLFTKEVARIAKQLSETGFGFQEKCRVLAEDLLATKYRIISDPDTPAAVRMRGIESLVEWANLKPKQDSTNSPTAGFSINIVLPTGGTVLSASTSEEQLRTLTTQQRQPMTIEQTTTTSEKVPPFEPLEPYCPEEGDPADEYY